MLTYTKKQLQEHFDISHNTLKDTIKVAGLNTSQRPYSEAEVTRMEQARHLLTAGMTYEEVRAVFLQKSADVPPEAVATTPATPGAAEAGHPEVQAVAGDVARAVEAGLTEQLQPVIDQVTEKVLAQLPMMAMQSLWTKTQQGRVQQAFQSLNPAWSALGGQPAGMQTIETTAQVALPTAPAAQPASAPPATAAPAPTSRRIPRSPTRTSAPTPAPETTPPPVVVDDLDKQVLGELVEGAALEALTDTETA